MGLQSLELILEWEQAFGVRLPDERYARVRTVADAIDLFSEELRASNGPATCMSLRAFTAIRRAYRDVGLSPSVRLTDPVEPVVAKLLADRFRYFRPPWPWRSPTVEELVRFLARERVAELVGPAHDWSRSDVRQVIRAYIELFCDTEDFADDAHLIDELGIS